MAGLSQNYLTQVAVNRECWTGAGVTRKQGLIEHRWDGSKTGSEADRLTWLSRTIENEIIPRLMLAHRMSPNG